MLSQVKVEVPEFAYLLIKKLQTFRQKTLHHGGTRVGTRAVFTHPHTDFAEGLLIYHIFASSQDVATLAIIRWPKVTTPESGNQDCLKEK